MNNKKSNNFITADCRLITDLPAAAPSSFNKNVTNGINSLDSVVLNNGQQRRNNSNNNSFNNGLRNTVRKKQFQQTTTTMDSGILISSSTLSSPLLFSSPSPPISPISSCTDLIRPQRKPRKSKKSRAGTNPSRITTPLSPSAISSCSLASFTSSSSGLSSGASSMGTLNDPDNNNIHHSPISSNVVICPDNTVIKSSSSSAASSAGFGDMTSNDDEDFHERCNFYDEQILSSLDSMQFSRQWSLPNGFASEVITNNSYPQMPTKSKNAKRRGNNKFQNNSTNNYPKITNPALQQFFFEQHQFYRKIYDQQFAALSSIKQISLNDTIQKQSKLDRQFSESAAKANVYIPHQHLGLPPLPPPPETYSPWQPSPCLGMPEPIITPSPCEEAFLNHLKSHQIPKKQQQQTMKEAATIVTTQSVPIVSSPILKTRANFHEQIRERLLLAAAEKTSDPSIQATPIKKSANIDKGKCSISDAAAIAGVSTSTPPAPLPQGRLSEDQSLFLQSLPLRLPFGTAAPASSSEPQKHFSSSYAAVIQSTPPSAIVPPHHQPPPPKPTPLNALNLPPLLSSTIGYDTSPKSSRPGSSKKSKKHRTFDNRLISTSSSTTTSSTQCNGNGSSNGGGGKKNNNQKNLNNIEFCMKDNDFPPISTLSTTSLSKDLSSSSQKGESGYHSEFSAQCSTADGETDSRCSDPVHRNYSSVVAHGSKSCTDLSDSKDETISITEDDCVSVPEEISRMDLLSEHICDYYERVTQTERTLLRKLRLRDMLYYSLAPLFPVCGLYVVGSSLNGFGNENSDMDLCLVITNGELDQRTHAVSVLSAVKEALASLSTIEEQTLITAKVPILRIKFRGPYSDIVVDLNANNLVAVRNTHLLCYYAFFDWRVRPLVTVIKEWAKQSHINDASRSTFTSYSLVLMVLHYLQVVDEPVLPSLQQLFPKRFNQKADIRTLNLSHPLEEIAPGSSFNRSNTSSLGSLLIGFFEYYANEYNYEKNAISIRLGREVQRADVVRHTTHWSPICIEEPFTRSNTAHSIYDEMIFKSIKQKFRDAHEILSKTSDLNSLLIVEPQHHHHHIHD